MSDKEWYIEDGHKPSLYGYVFTQMVLGAAYAAIFAVSVMGIILTIYAIGQLLPEDSKNAPPPMPQIESSLVVSDATQAI
jgi:hypothetical protein